MYKYLLSLSLISLHSHAWDFEEKTLQSGLLYSHGFDQNVLVNEPQRIASGLALGDINGDGWDDIFVVTGETKDQNGLNTNPNKLFIAQGDGTYIDMASEFKLDSQDIQSSGPLIIDLNGDGYRDLIFGSVGVDPKTTIYLNQNNKSFTKLENNFPSVFAYGISAADTDKDGDLDIFISRWLQDTSNAYWLNDGSAHFSDVTHTMTDGVSFRNSFTPLFVDINNNNWVDLLVTSDFSASKYFSNDKTGYMVEMDRAEITDENGMGAAIGDYDNDGDFDWFVSSIFDIDGEAEGSWGVSGNRLYNNDGSGNFVDVSIPADVNRGYWGWGSCFADFNNDMFLDIFHVNGFDSLPAGESDFVNDPSRLFINNKNGLFSERSTALNLVDDEMGRAILCFDYDRDGDVDIFIANNRGQSRFFQNNLDNDNNYITLKLNQGKTNMDAIGAKIELTTGETTQIRQIQAGGNFASTVPTEQYFGLEKNSSIDSIFITWPDDSTQTLTDVNVNQYLLIKKPPTISGQIINQANNQALSNITLQLFSEDGEMIAESTTDINGRYFFNNIDSGNYRLITSADNFVNQAFPNISCQLNNCDPMLSQLINLSDENGFENTNFSLMENSDFYPNLNGLWFNSDQSGHGLQIEIIDSNGQPTIFVSWYAHLNNNTIWLTGTGPINKGQATVDLYITNGASFPPNFDPDAVNRVLWGNLTFNFSDLNNATIIWDTIDDRFEDSSLTIERLSQLSQSVTNNSSIDACLSGTFYNPSQDGHGIMLEVLGEPASSIVMTWFTYDNDNNQFWLVANGKIKDDIAVLNSFYSINSNFPPNFNTDDISNIDWGLINLMKIDNNNLLLSWLPNENHPEYLPNVLEMSRLTQLKGLGLDCQD